jgi:hypothetical protein
VTSTNAVAASPIETVTIFRQSFTGAALIAAGVLIAAGELTTPPGSTGTTETQVAAFVGHPELTQVSALLFHFGYLLVLPGIVGLLGLTRLRATKLANLGAFLAFLGFASLAGNGVVDLFTLGAGQQLETNDAVRYLDATGSLVGAAPFIIPAFLGSFVGLALLMVALGRAGELSWLWVAITIVGLALIVAAPLHVVTVLGFLAMTVGLVAAGARLLRT